MTTFLEARAREWEAEWLAQGIEQSRAGTSSRCRVHRYPDGHMAVFHGPRKLADYEPDGSLVSELVPVSACPRARSGGRGMGLDNSRCPAALPDRSICFLRHVFTELPKARSLSACQAAM